MTEIEANRLIAEHKEIKDKINWKRQPHKGIIFEFQVPLYLVNDTRTQLRLIVNKNTEIKKYSFTILYNSYRIKSLDIGKNHDNPPFNRKNMVGKKHKHTWTDQWEDNWAYKPDDITDGAEFSQVLQEFFLECNIKCDVNIPELPPTQEELNLDDELYGDHGVYK